MKKMWLTVAVALLAGLAAVHPRARMISYFEIMDETWCPEIVRSFQQDALRLNWEVALMTLPGRGEMEDLLATAYRKSKATQILELASGGGGPSPILAEKIEAKLRIGNPSAKVSVRMSDLFPNVRSWEKLAQNNTRISFISEPVDALKVPKEYSKGSFRLICGAFHHFPPALAEGLIADAVRDKQGLAILDGASTPINMFFLPILGFFVELALLFLDFSAVKLFLFPVFAITMTHDSFVSSLRMYGKQELEEMCKRADPKGEYDWVIRGYPPIFPQLQVAVGTPR